MTKPPLPASQPDAAATVAASVFRGPLRFTPDPIGWPSVVAVCLCAGPALAQTGSTASLRLTPSASLTQTVTDNFQPGQGSARRAAITQAIGGLSLTGGSRRLSGSATYSLSQIMYWGHPEENQRQQALSARVSSEFVEGHGFVDASANISRQATSALGIQSPDNSLVNANSAQVRTYSVSPSWRGQLPGLWSYQFTAGYSATASGAGSNFGSSSNSYSLQLNSAQFGRLSWGLNAQHNIQRHASTDAVRDNRLFGTLGVAVPEADLKITFSGGTERSNAATTASESAATWGVRADWAPSNRTQFGASYDKRQFGSTHSLTLQHRSARTVWNYTNSQQISATASTTSLTFFDLYYSLFASIEPDPVKRTELVNVYLLLNGINPTSTAPGGFATQATTHVRSQALSFALQGIRSSLTAAVNRSDSAQLNPSLSLVGDLANGQHVIQTGLSASLSHRLTPDSSLNLVASQLNSTGSLQTQGTRLRTLSLSWSGNPSRRTTVSATLRHSEFDSATNPYRENAAVAAVNFRF